MESKNRSMCNIEKHINNFYEKDSECRNCNSKRGENVTMIIKTKYQTNESYIMKKIEIKFYLNKIFDKHILKI